MAEGVGEEGVGEGDELGVLLLDLPLQVGDEHVALPEEEGMLVSNVGYTVTAAEVCARG